MNLFILKLANLKMFFLFFLQIILLLLFLLTQYLKIPKFWQSRSSLKLRLKFSNSKILKFQNSKIFKFTKFSNSQIPQIFKLLFFHFFYQYKSFLQPTTSPNVFDFGTIGIQMRYFKFIQQIVHLCHVFSEKFVSCECDSFFGLK